MKRTLTTAAAAMLFCCATPPVALAGQSCRPVTGHFEASLVPPGQGHCAPNPSAFCTAGRVQGGIQGDYQFVMTGAVPSTSLGGTPTVLFFTGRSDVALNNGAHVFGTDTGSLDLPPGHGGFASLISFTGGTGPLADASGQIRLRGQFDALEAKTSGDYTGTICVD